jgi:hypothetical protein
LAACFPNWYLSTGNTAHNWFAYLLGKLSVGEKEEEIEGEGWGKIDGEGAVPGHLSGFQQRWVDHLCCIILSSCQKHIGFFLSPVRNR